MNNSIGGFTKFGPIIKRMQFVMQAVCRNYGMSLEEAMPASTAGTSKAFKKGQRLSFNSILNVHNKKRFINLDMKGDYEY